MCVGLEEQIKKLMVEEFETLIAEAAMELGDTGSVTVTVPAFVCEVFVRRA